MGCSQGWQQVEFNFFAMPDDAKGLINLSHDDWGATDTGVGVEGVHMMVFGGRPVWPVALCWLVLAPD